MVNTAYDEGNRYAYSRPQYLAPLSADQKAMLNTQIGGFDALTRTIDGMKYYDYAGTRSVLNDYEASKSAKAQEEAARAAILAAITGRGSGGSGASRTGFRTGAQLLSRLRGSDPFKNLEAALMKARTGAESTGADAISRLRSALEARTNPYQDVQFNTPVAAANPLADYMSASGVSTGQVDALRALLGSLSANAATADQQMADRMSTSWTNDQQSRLADASTSEAAFKQALAQSYAQQEAQLALMRQQRQDALTEQLVQLAVQSGMTPEQLGVTV